MNSSIATLPVSSLSCADEALTQRLPSSFALKH